MAVHARARAQLARRIRTLNESVARGTFKVEAIQSMCQKLASAPAPAPTALQPRRPYQFSEDPAPAPAPAKTTANRADPHDRPPLPPPRTAKAVAPAISETPAEQVQGMWYGWA